MRALNDSGTLLATNTVTATVNKPTPPPPPPQLDGCGDADDRERVDDHGDLVNWRAVYDANGDKSEDDPGTIEFLIDGNQVLTEDLTRPSATASPTARLHHVTNGTHTFQVRALNDTGTLLATNTVTATVNNHNTTPPTG